MLLIILSLLSLAEGQGFYVNNGKIVVGNDNTCNVTMYNNTLYDVKHELPGLYYGLIKYDCNNNTKGYIISKPQCFECGVYCPQNDLLLTCNHFWFPFILGSFIGVSAAASLLYVLRFLKNRYFNVLIDKISAARNSRKEKKLRKIRKYLMDKHVEEVAEIEELQPEASNSRNSRRLSTPAILLASLMASSHLQHVSSCDRSLYVKSSNIICEASSCREASSYLINLENNMKLCFNGPTDRPFTIRLADYRATATYNYIYMTSSYKLKTKVHSRCKGAGHCWRGEGDKKSCRKFEKHETFQEQDNTTIYGYGCDMTNKYYDWCALGYKCSWYQWSIVPEGEMYKVYKLNSRGFEVDFEFTTIHGKHMVSYSDNNLNGNMHLAVTEDITVPMSIVSSTGADSFFSNHIIGIRDKFYDVDASDINLPVKNRIGDIQIDAKGTAIIDRLSVVCRANDEQVDCVTSEPAVDVVIKSKKYKDFKINEKVGESIVKQKLSTHRSVAVMFSHNDLESIELSKPKCNMSISYSYGCKECNQNARIIVTASSIWQEGMVYFKSNCTFNAQYLACNKVPQTLELLNGEKYCYLYMEALNVTLYTNVEYEFVGEVMSNPLIFSQSENFGSLMSSIATNPNFLDGIMKSFLLTTGMFAVSTSLMRMIGKLAIAKVSADAIRQENNNI